MMNKILFGEHSIGDIYPVFIVAEMSANHCRDYEVAVNIIRAAKESGADAIKLQTFSAQTHTIASTKTYFQIGGGTLWDGTTLYDLYQKAEMPWEWQPKLQQIARDLGLLFFSAAVDKTSVDFLETLNVPVHKLSSFELVDLPLIEKIARTGKPLILSTGMATLSEIEEAVTTAQRAGVTELLLLKCNSSYPAPLEEMNLLTIPHLRSAFNLPIGLSDHTYGITAPVAAVALGACLIEKHFTLSRSLPSPDSAFSLEPQEFKQMVESVRATEKMLGRVHYGVNPHEEKSLVFRRSLFVVKEVAAGELFTNENVRSIRPGYGLPPRYLKEIVNQRRARSFIESGTPLTWSLLE